MKDLRPNEASFAVWGVNFVITKSPPVRFPWQPSIVWTKNVCFAWNLIESASLF
jgi:hypothetical protein